MRMRTDKLITIIFSVILGVIGLFTIYILASSFLYDAGIVGGDDEYESLESLLEEEKQPDIDTASVTEETSTPAADSFTAENDAISEQPAEDDTGQPAQTANFHEERQPTPQESQEPEAAQSTQTSTPQNTALEPSSPSLRTSTPAGGGNRRARYESLKKKFNYGTDATGAGWFVHEAWDNPGLGRNALICYVSQNGELNLATQYVGNERIYHNRAQIQIGRNTIPTAEATSDDIQYSSVGGNIKEKVQYRFGNNKAIVEQITSNPQAPVSITLLGEEQVEFTLGNVDKQAILECKEMAELLSYL